MFPYKRGLSFLHTSSIYSSKAEGQSDSEADFYLIQLHLFMSDGWFMLFIKWEKHRQEVGGGEGIYFFFFCKI